MFDSLFFGTALIALTVVIQTIGLIALAGAIARLARWFRLHLHNSGRVIAMVATVLGLFAIHTVEIWLWGAALVFIRAAPGFADALYLSTAAFSTFGPDMSSIAPGWRLLLALESVNGLLLIGWSIAFLVGASTRHGPFRVGEHF
ncbi:MAG TPA: hypothetical protein VMF67_03540 [Rhizomicrobium sp.]|nr:hypothetical protein [Rhizomicrobium sp.]